MAKVTDFGASRMLPKDTIQFMTIVQGTLGYLDPEYLQERKLTEKSDVYSFGVVLLELVTGKKAIYSEGPDEGKSLAASFLQAMKDNRVEGILDTSIMGEEMMELLQEVVELGRQCLSVKGEDRPSMAQVADNLKTIRSSWRELLLLKHNETQLLIERSGMDSANLLPSMYLTAQTLSMDIETPYADHASSTYRTLEYI
jgi:serine/threonine protein kinase